MMKQPKQIKHDLEVKQIRKLTKALMPAHYEWHRSCIYHAAATLLYLGRVYGNRNLVLQAGSATWPRINMEEDDGVMMTHFSYQFDLYDPLSMAQLHKGLLPEMHAWVADKKYRLILDLTTCFIPIMCREAGMEYKSEVVDYLWCKIDNLPEGVEYIPDLNAMKICEIGLANTMNHEAKDQFLKTAVILEPE